jgi:two-component system C4-dicarboxylate transport response regulator DctD
MKPQVLLIEDDDALRMALSQTLSLEGISVIQANGLDQARRAIRANFAGVVLSDIRMPNKNGFDVLNYVKSIDQELPVVFITGEADVPMALRAMKEGAYDFLEKPCSSKTLQEVLNRALGYRNMVRKARSFKNAMKRHDPASINFPGKSQAVQGLRAALRKVSGLGAHVYLHGDRGVGKKLAAYTIHSLSEDRKASLSINFQNAQLNAVEVLDVPEHPTDLSLKNIDSATMDQQRQILKLINLKENLRVIFTSEYSMSTLMSNGINEDISALQLVQIKVPTLRDRKPDLPVLMESLIRQSARSLDVDMPDVPHMLYAQVLAKEWPGNLSELREFAQSMVLGLNVRVQKQETLTLAQQLEAFERLILTETLKRNCGKATEAANVLGLPRKTFYDRLARFNIRAKDYKNN